MKKTFLSALIWATFTCSSIISNAQTGVTKYGTNALANNNTNGHYNTGFGYYALNANAGGSRNTATGALSLRHNITGEYNTATGYSSLYNNVLGINNSAFGAYSLFTNEIGQANTAVGAYSLWHNIASYNTAVGHLTLAENTGESNTAIGYRALNFNLSGYQNTAVGDQSLYSNTSGKHNTATGYHALHDNDDGSYNTANGYDALAHNSRGIYNTATGYRALVSNTIGEYNTAYGVDALYSNDDGINNTATGIDALSNNISGSHNTATGLNVMYSNISGSGNTAVGLQALFVNTTGSNNTALGYNADVTKTGLANATAIGYNAKVNASNKVRIGNNNVTSIGGQVGWITFSDGRYKRDIKENIPGLAFINSLRPVSYTVNVKGLNEYYNKNIKQVSRDKKTNNQAEDAESKKAEDAAGKIVHSGFVAQEVEEAAKKLNFEFSGVDKPENKDDLYGLRYENFIVPLVKAVQELSKQNEDLQQQINELKAMKTATAQTNVSSQFSTKLTLTDIFLEQNAPNPFNKATTIRYSLPEKFTNAQLVVTDKNGKTLKQIKISGNGKGTVNIDAATFSAGTYLYSLIADGRVISSKQMVLSK